MIKLANFTLHDQSHFLDKWREMGFDVDPTPRSPLVEYEKAEWTEKKIVKVVGEELKKIKNEGFDGILIGGLSNVMAYAWQIAIFIGLDVYMAKTPRKRTPDGKFVFELAGVQKLLIPFKVLEEFLR